MIDGGELGKTGGYPANSASTIYLDRRGTLWVASENTVVFLPLGAKKFQSTSIKIRRPWQIVDSPSGTLWMAETQRSVRPIPLPGIRPSSDIEVQVGSTGILFDDDGSLWVTSLGDGMRRLPVPDGLAGTKISEMSNAVEGFTAKDGLTTDHVICMLKDREGSIWVGTSAGLDRFRKGTLVPILLPSKFTLKALIPEDNGDLWVGSMSVGRAVIHENAFKQETTTFSTAYGFRDAAGVIWVLGFGLTVNHVFRLANGRATTFAPMPSGTRPDLLGTVLAEDQTGKLWFEGGPRGLYFLKNGQWAQFEKPPNVPEKMATVTFTDSNAGVWFGFTDNTMMVLDGTNIRVFSLRMVFRLGP